MLISGRNNEINQKKNKYHAFFYSKNLRVKKKWVPLHRQLVILNYIYHFPIYRESARESRFPFLFLLRMRLFFLAQMDTAGLRRKQTGYPINNLIPENCTYMLNLCKFSVPANVWRIFSLFFHIDHWWVVYRPQINTDWHRLRAKGSD